MSYHLPGKRLSMGLKGRKSIKMLSKCCQNQVLNKKKIPQIAVLQQFGRFSVRCLAELKFRIKMKGFVCEIFVVV